MGEGYLAGYCNSPSIKNWRSGLGWEQGWAGGSQVLLTVRMWSRVRDSGVLFWDEENVRGTGWVPGGGLLNRGAGKPWFYGLSSGLRSPGIECAGLGCVPSLSLGA